MSTAKSAEAAKGRATQHSPKQLAQSPRRAVRSGVVAGTVGFLPGAARVDGRVGDVAGHDTLTASFTAITPIRSVDRAA
ncbi:hypothetical protein GCM10010315_42010 [Streptomyces luteosporeus]|uniref:Uncharacterized protein n=1 Tax=Streptomyces luteosporeus TaxID=173856 RepID=A0ABN3TY95_9ACTN